MGKRSRLGKRQRAKAKTIFEVSNLSNLIHVNWTGTVASKKGNSYHILYNDGDEETCNERELKKWSVLSDEPADWINTKIKKPFPYLITSVVGNVASARSSSNDINDTINFRYDKLVNRVIDRCDVDRNPQ